MTEIIPTDLNPDYLKNLVADILAEAKQQGASSAEVDVGTHKGFSVTIRQGDVETIEYNQDKAIGITVYFGQRTGSASLSDIRPSAIQSAVSAACNIARFTDEDTFAGLADKSLLAFNYPTIDHGHAWDVSVEQAIDLAKACETKALQLDKKITNTEGVSVSTASAWNLYGNSEGFIGIYPVFRHEMNCVLIAKDRDEMQRDYSYTVSCDPSALESIQYLARTAVERTVRRLGAVRLSTRRAPVLFVAEEARGLLGGFISAISGGNLYRKSSFLLDHLGKKIFPEYINLREQPHLPKGLGSVAFDSDGVMTRPNVFVEQGILQSYSLGVYSARKLGLQTTGNAGGVHNLTVSTGQKTLPELLKLMDTGLLVTELMGHGVNMVTGDYSRGATGFWVEGGEIQYPVQEITIASRLQDMFMHMVEVGNDVDRRGNVLTGSILIEEMMIAGD